MKDTLTTKDGLLYQDGHAIMLPLADMVAREHGFQYAEQLVRHLEKNMKSRLTIYSEFDIADLNLLRSLNQQIGQLPYGPERQKLENQLLAALIVYRLNHLGR